MAARDAGGRAEARAEARAETRAETRGTARGISEEALLQAAAQLFARHGYRKTSLEDVAEALAIKKGSLYHYIRSKEELLARIYDRILDRIEDAVRPHAGARLAADERLRRMIDAHVAVVAAERDMLAVVFKEEPELAAPSQTVIRQRKRAYERIFERVVEEGQAEGVLRPFPPRLLVLVLLGACNWMYHWYRAEGRSTPAELAARITLLLESGWRAGDDRRNGAWARAGAVDEALAPAREALARTEDEVRRLRAELARAEDRLRDGLVVES